MNNELSQVMQQLQVDPGTPQAEWTILREAIRHTPGASDAILKWVFADHKGYVESRAQAGLEYFQVNPREGWSILERLVNSNEPDDRETALAVAIGLDLERSTQLVKHLLHDAYPYLQLEAAKYLAVAFPVEVRACLYKLLVDQPRWVGEAAKKLLLEMGENPG